MRLLLVEDEVEIQGFLQRSLTEAGYQVEAAGDARTAERMTHSLFAVTSARAGRKRRSVSNRLRYTAPRAPVAPE